MAGRFFVAAGLALLALLAGLWFLMKNGDEPVSVESRPVEAPVAVAPPSKPALKASPSPRAPTAPVVPRRPTHEERPTPGTVAPTPLETGSAAAPQPPIVVALKEQVLFTEALILECNEKAQKAGKRLHGEAAFGFSIARSNGKIVIESTGTEYTNFDPAVTDCLRESANGMVFEALPEGVEALTAYRRINFVDGMLERQALSDYGVTRPPPPPKL
jgi:hypothetical protein